MIYKFILPVILFISCIFFFPAAHLAAEKQPEIALIYTSESADMVLTANILERLTDVQKIQVDEIKEGTLNSFAGIVFIGTDEKELPKAAVDELNAFKKPALAIGNEALQLKPFEKWKLAEQVEIKQVDGHILRHPIYWEEIIPQKDVEILRTSASFQKEYPFLIQLKNNPWTYMTMIPKESEFIYTYPFLISSVLQLSLPNDHEAFIVISDVNAKTDVEALKRKVRLLQKYQIPIHIEIASVSIDEADGLTYYVADNRELLDYLQALQEDGVTFILSEQVEPVKKGLHYFAMNHIYPTIVMGESPLFSSHIVEESLNIYSGQAESIKQLNYTVPITIGSGEYPLYEMERTMNQLFAVPGSLISFHYPNYLEQDYLEELIHLLKKSNVHWLNFQKMNHSVQTNQLLVTQDSTGRLEIEESFRFLHRLHIMFERHPFELGLWILIIIVSLFVLLFFINTLRLRIVLRKRLFEERKSHG